MNINRSDLTKIRSSNLNKSKNEMVQDHLDSVGILLNVYDYIYGGEEVIGMEPTQFHEQQLLQLDLLQFQWQWMVLLMLLQLQATLWRDICFCVVLIVII